MTSSTDHAAENPVATALSHIAVGVGCNRSVQMALSEQDIEQAQRNLETEISVIEAACELTEGTFSLLDVLANTETAEALLERMNDAVEQKALEVEADISSVNPDTLLTKANKIRAMAIAA